MVQQPKIFFVLGRRSVCLGNFSSRFSHCHFTVSVRSVLCERETKYPLTSLEEKNGVTMDLFFCFEKKTPCTSRFVVLGPLSTRRCLHAVAFQQ